MLILHISIALSSLAYTAWLYAKPSPTKIKVSYALVAATIGTGTYLVVKAPAHLTTACMEGLVYLAVVATGIVLARRKFLSSAAQ